MSGSCGCGGGGGSCRTGCVCSGDPIVIEKPGKPGCWIVIWCDVWVLMST